MSVTVRPNAGQRDRISSGTLPQVTEDRAFLPYFIRSAWWNGFCWGAVFQAAFAGMLIFSFTRATDYERAFVGIYLFPDAFLVLAQLVYAIRFLFTPTTVTGGKAMLTGLGAGTAALALTFLILSTPSH